MVLWVRRLSAAVRRRPLDLHIFCLALVLVGGIFVFAYQSRVFWEVVITDRVSLEGAPVFQALSGMTILTDLVWSPFMVASAVGIWLRRGWGRKLGLIVGGVTTCMGVEGVLFFPLTNRFGVDAMRDFTRYYNFVAYMANYGILAVVGFTMIFYLWFRKIEFGEPDD